MIAADTSAWIDFARGTASRSCLALERALQDGALVMPSPVLFEVLSGPGLTEEAKRPLLRLPRLEAGGEYWERAASMRRKLLAKGLKARAMDCLIAQACLEHGVGLIAADEDFRHFVAFGLRLL